MTAPTGQAREILNLAPAAPPRPGKIFLVFCIFCILWLWWVVHISFDFGVLLKYFVKRQVSQKNKYEAAGQHKFYFWKSWLVILSLEFYIHLGEAALYTSWRSLAGETDRITVLWFLIKCSLQNLFNRLSEYSWKVLLPWQIVNMFDWCVKIRFWYGEKIGPLFDMVAVWKGKAGAHAHKTIHRPADRGSHRLPHHSLSDCLGKELTTNAQRSNHLNMIRTLWTSFINGPAFMKSFFQIKMRQNNLNHQRHPKFKSLTQFKPAFLVLNLLGG